MATDTDSKTLLRATNHIDRLKLPVPARPERDLEWPDNVGDLGSDELALHLTQWSGWSTYARYQLAQVETNLSAFEEEANIRVQELVFKSKGDYETVTEVKAAVASMPGVRRLKAKVLKASALKKMLGALLEGYEKKYNTISREISRRESEFSENGGSR